MKIGEVAEITGLSISNIRFYEKKGLLEPARNEQSRYRDYSQEDIERLKRIILYRKIDLSLETIHALLANSLTLEDALTQQVTLLKEKQEILQSSLDLCEAILTDDRSEPDIDYYLHYVKAEEAKGHKFAEIEELLADYAFQTKFDVFASNPYIFVLFNRNPYISRFARIIWTVLWLLLPILFIVDCSMDQSGLSTIELMVGLLMIIILYGPLLQVYRNRRDTNLSQK